LPAIFLQGGLTIATGLVSVTVSLTNVCLFVKMMIIFLSYCMYVSSNQCAFVCMSVSLSLS